MISVTVAYDGGLHPDLDVRLRRMAGFQGGVEQGSGQMIVPPYRRDIEFKFPWEGYEKFAAGVRDAVVHDYPKQNVRIL